MVTINNGLSFFLFLKDLRIKRGISKHRVADHLGIDPTVISDYEQGLITLPPNAIYSLCVFYSQQALYESQHVAQAFNVANDSIKQVVRVALKIPSEPNNVIDINCIEKNRVLEFQNNARL